MAGEHRDDEGPLIPRRVLLAVFLLLVGLLVAVVAVGLIRDQVNVDGLIIALMPVISGVILGGVIRTKRDDS